MQLISFLADGLHHSFGAVFKNYDFAVFRMVHAVDGGHAVSHRDDGTGFLFAGEQIVILDLFF